MGTFPCQKYLVKGEKSKWPTSWQKRSITPQPHGSSAKLMIAQMQRRSFHKEGLAVLKSVHTIIFHFLSIQVLPWWPIYLGVNFVLNGQRNTCWFQFIYNKCCMSTVLMVKRTNEEYEFLIFSPLLVPPTYLFINYYKKIKLPCHIGLGPLI